VITALVCAFVRDAMLNRFLAHPGASVKMQAGLTLAVCLAVSVALYGALAFALRMDEAALLRRLLRRARR
jgi:hypothetical protein